MTDLDDAELDCAFEKIAEARERFEVERLIREGYSPDEARLMQANDAVYARECPDGWIYVIKMSFNHRLTIGPHLTYGTYDDAWCFATREQAVVAAKTWDPAKSAEPDGWIKHPFSYRYRPDGDAAREYDQRKAPPP